VNDVKQTLVISIVSFLLGGFVTYFVTDYIYLKSQAEASSQLSTKTQKIAKALPKLKKQRQPKRVDPFDHFFQNALNSFGTMRPHGFAGSAFDALNDDFGNDPVQIYEKEDNNYKYIELVSDGLDKENLDINIENGMVTIKGEIKKSDQRGNSQTQYYSTFQKSFNVPRGVVEEEVSFDSRDNKVIVKFPKQKV
tara:strand:+ start:129808 stop:130389 length:582 start_codon:yes stop_codon:yes gene_type:complete